MSATMRATCPGCRATLGIPAAFAGRAVKCRKCGAVMRTKPAAGPPPGTAPAAPLDATGTHPVAAPAPTVDPFAGLSPPAPLPLPPSGAVPVLHPVRTPDPGPVYAPPAYPQPAELPAVAGPDFTPSEVTRAYARRTPYRKPGGGRAAVRLGLLAVVAGGLVAAGVFGAKYLPELGGGGGAKPEAKKGGEPKPTPPPSAAAAGVFPRRLLFVHVSNYLYLNPLTGAPAPGGNKGPDRTRPQAGKLAYEWRVPADQVYVVSDTDEKPDARPPVKPVVAAAFEKFFETSRPQDRVVVYFGGHVLLKKAEAGEAAYLVPVEGDPDDDATLIPVADVYAKLAACKAAQRVVIWDVCRFNPDRGRQRPGSEPMTEAVAQALAAAPPGVQVVLTCKPGENALEFTNLEPDGPNKGVVAGSSFLEAVRPVAAGRNPPKASAPADPVPVFEWATAVGRRLNDVAAAVEGGPRQTLRLAGEVPAALAPVDPGEPAPARFELPGAAAGADPKAKREVAAAVQEFALPGIKTDDAEGAVAAFPYPPDALDAYQADVPLKEVTDPANRTKYEFRLTVLQAFDTIRKAWAKDGKAEFRESFVGPTNDAVKKDIQKEQSPVADAIALLGATVDLLEAADKDRAAQPRRWQAHYDYALAQAKARLAFLQEYNLALGGIRTEVLPARDPKLGHDGYKLVAAAGMKVKEAKKLADEARELFDKMAADYKGTPWAVQAKRDRGLNLGLAWVPFNSKAAAAKDE